MVLRVNIKKLKITSEIIKLGIN